MRTAPRAAAWAAWAVWTCNTPQQGIWSKESGLRPALFLGARCSARIVGWGAGPGPLGLIGKWPTTAFDGCYDILRAGFAVDGKLQGVNAFLGQSEPFDAADQLHSAVEVRFHLHRRQELPFGHFRCLHCDG